MEEWFGKKNEDIYGNENIFQLEEAILHHEYNDVSVPANGPIFRIYFRFNRIKEEEH